MDLVTHVVVPDRAHVLLEREAPERRLLHRQAVGGGAPRGHQCPVRTALGKLACELDLRLHDAAAAKAVHVF